MIMDKIVLEVKPGMADRWKRASPRMKQQAAQAVEKVLYADTVNEQTNEREESGAKFGNTPLSGKEREQRLQEAKEFYRQHAVDFSSLEKWSREDLHDR